MTPELQNRIFECHPEVAFWALNGNRALQSAKKIKSRPNPDGLAYRRKLLGDAGYPPQLLNADTFRTSQVGPDDILDACAAAWSANRICHRRGDLFPRQAAKIGTPKGCEWRSGVSAVRSEHRVTGPDP